MFHAELCLLLLQIAAASVNLLQQRSSESCRLLPAVAGSEAITLLRIALRRSAVLGLGQRCGRLSRPQVGG